MEIEREKERKDTLRLSFCEERVPHSRQRAGGRGGGKHQGCWEAGRWKMWAGAFTVGSVGRNRQGKKVSGAE